VYLLGYDIGSSSIKAALVEADTGKTKCIVQFPEKEMKIISKQNDWAEQDPELWWKHVCEATKKLLSDTRIDPSEIRSIGIAYQMHGLVLVDKQLQSIRPSIIWCDSRAVNIGDEAFSALGKEYCINNLLNSPGNFTASKLKWVKDNEPAVFNCVYKAMLPGDFIAMKLTGEVNTTISGLSEGIFWDFKKKEIAQPVVSYYGFEKDIIPEIVPTFSIHGQITKKAAEETGLNPGTKVAYRAGDQPNNAFALGVNNPGEVAATGGTSGVVYGITDQPVCDPEFRVNTFAHVNNSEEQFRAGVLLCINGAGITYSWLKNQIAESGSSFEQMEKLAAGVPVNSEGLRVISFGNGAERILQNKNIGANIINLNFNRHGKSHMFRAGLEGVAYSFVFGIEILKELGMNISSMRVGNDNLFQSTIFSETITGLLGCTVEVIASTGASGAARAAGFGAGIYGSIDEAARLETSVKKYDTGKKPEYDEGYQLWKADLMRLANV